MYYKGTGLKKYHRDEDYYMPDTSRDMLDRHDFRYRSSMSDSKESIYEHFFPVYRYHADITLEGRFMLVRETGKILVDVFDAGSKGIYAPWYYDEGDLHAYIIKIIDSNIEKEMKRLGIKKKEDSDG